MPNYPEITYRFPTLADGARSDLRPQIVLDWSNDIDTAQFIADGTRASLVALLDDETSTIIATSYVSYTAASRRLILEPAADLDRDTRFRIVVKSGVLDTYGRRSKNEYTWTFRTDVASIGVPSLLSPADQTVQSVFPTLTWSSVSATGTVFYNVQLDDRFDFGALDYNQVTTDLSITPAGSFADETTYYWRVSAYTSGATGGWSETRSFYYGTSYQSHLSSRQEWADADTFGVYDTGFDNGQTNLSDWPSDITISFTSQPTSAYENYITLKKKSILPRNDVTSSYAETSVSGTWASTSGTIITSSSLTPQTIYNLTFTPSEDIAENTRYELRVNRRLVNTDNLVLGEELRYYWTGAYDPLYVDPITLVARFRSETLTIPDDLIYFNIFMASLDAKARYYGYLMAVPQLFGDSLKENVVRDTPNLNSFGVLRWVEAVATYNILKSILNEELRNIGRTRKLGDYTDSLTADFVKGIKEALDRAADDIKAEENLLCPSDVPMTVPRHSRWSPIMYNFDTSIPTESKRDDWL